MADPFANIRRRPAAATYGRKALAARKRAAVSVPSFSTAAASAPNAGAPKLSAALSVVSTKVRDASDASDQSIDSTSSSSDISSPESDGEAGDRPWVRRTAHLAISRLDSLYENTKSGLLFHGMAGAASVTGDGNSTAAPSSSRDLLESTKDGWDLDCVPSDLLSSVGMSGAERAARDKLGSSAKQPSKRVVGEGSKVIKKVKSSQPTANRVNSNKNAQPSHSRAARVGKGSKRSTLSGKRERRAAGLATTEPTPASSQPASSDHEATALAFELTGLLSGSLKCTQSQRPRRLAGQKNSFQAAYKDNDAMLSSSPSSTPGRLLDSSKGSKASSSRAGSECSEGDNICGKTKHLPAHVSATPMAQVGNRQVLDAIQGPSTATSKRMQMRAHAHNVVYTYGRSRNEDDGDGVGGGGCYSIGDGSESSPTLRLQSVFETTDRLTLDATQNNRSKRASGCLLDAVNHTDSIASSNNSSRTEDDLTVSSGMFKQHVGSIIRELSASGRTEDSIAAACETLLYKLEDQSFCDNLLSSKFQLSAILHALGRTRDDPVVLSTTTVLIAIAFQMPLTMQMLVFEKQILECVAGVLKTVSTAALPDILALRHKDDFDTNAQQGCAVQICRLAHGHNLLDNGKVPLSTYNLALGALYGFSCSADVASVAMAPLLRSEMHVSGCLGLIAEQLLTRSIPAFVDSQRKCLSKKPTPAAGGSFIKRLGVYNQSLQFTDDNKNNNDDGYDDAWMDFDLPEETKGRGPASFTATKSKSQTAGKKSVATGTKSAGLGSRGAKLFDRTLDKESSAMAPNLAIIGMELEILRFCIAANTDNQDELLSMESCVPALLDLLTACQQSWVMVVDMPLDQVLEILALGLQLLVNLSYGSTVFCSRFFAYQGLETVAKSIALISFEPNSGSGKHSQSVRRLGSFVPGSRASHAEDTISSLKYDVLLISCALLINVMESDPSSTAYFSHVYQSPRCQLAVKCFPACVCAEKVPLVVLVVGAFLARCLEEDANVDTTVSAGYLAVLLGFLVRDPGPTRQTVLGQLPGRNTSILLKHIQKFVDISSTVNQNIANGLLSSLGVASVDRASRYRVQQQEYGEHQCLPSPLNERGDSVSVANPRVGGSRLDMYDKHPLSASLQSVIDTLGKI
ncbi:hypothetical protein IWW48_002145 [Coemansia sp. RSA 1200]|nr:hypothetical protein IWW48_002145 [Coemansia sp. RSA 1200]